MKPSGFEVKHYETRLDRFRVRENIGIRQWAEQAGMSRTQLNRYRSDAAQPRSNTVADLVRSASAIVGRDVAASELYDLGEDEPVRRRDAQARTNRIVQKTYRPRFDELLRRLGVPLKRLATESGLSRQAIRRFRSDATYPVVPTVRAIVTALRRMGYRVTPSDVIDVGESRTDTS